MPLEDLKKAAFAPQSASPDPAPAAVATPALQAQPAAQPGPYTVLQSDGGLVVQMSRELGGEIFKGANWDEVGPQVLKAKAHANAYIKQLKANPQQPENALPEFQYMTPEQETAAQNEAAEFLRSLILTPEVRQQIADEAISKRFGIDASILPQTVQQIGEAHNQFQVANLQMDFHRECRDYLDTPENAKALSECNWGFAGASAYAGRSCKGLGSRYL